MYYNPCNPTVPGRCAACGGPSFNKLCVICNTAHEAEVHRKKEQERIQREFQPLKDHIRKRQEMTFEYKHINPNVPDVLKVKV